MTKHMYCPMSFQGKYPFKCTPNCAWAIECGTTDEPKYCCAVPYGTSAGEAMINSRPLKDDE